MAKPQEKVSFLERLKQIGQVFAFTAKQDKWFVPLIIAAVLIPLALTVLLVLLAWAGCGSRSASWSTLLAALIVLNLRSNTAMMNAAEGQPGAAASIIENMRGDWRVRPAASSTTQFDMVHMVIGRPGVILLGEGHPQRVRTLIGQEKRRLSKVIGNAPMYDYVIGQRRGRASIRKLRTTMMRLPRNLTGKDVNALDKRLGALMARPQMPKGAIPKNMRPAARACASTAPADAAGAPRRRAGKRGREHVRHRRLASESGPEDSVIEATAGLASGRTSLEGVAAMSANVCVDLPVLRKGDKGGIVRLQQMLNVFVGHGEEHSTVVPLNDDGEFGSKRRKRAVKRSKQATPAR